VILAEIVTEKTTDSPRMLCGQSAIGFSAEAVGSEIFTHKKLLFCFRGEKKKFLFVFILPQNA
jgi:hypothetical protein